MLCPQKFSTYLFINKMFLNCSHTGKCLSKALIFASTNPQYDDRLFNTWKFQAQTWGEHVVYRNCFWHSQHVLPMFWKKESFWQRYTCTNFNWKLPLLLILVKMFYNVFQSFFLELYMPTYQWQVWEKGCHFASSICFFRAKCELWPYCV